MVGFILFGSSAGHIWSYIKLLAEAFPNVLAVAKQNLCLGYDKNSSPEKNRLAKTKTREIVMSAEYATPAICLVSTELQLSLGRCRSSSGPEREEAGPLGGR